MLKKIYIIYITTNPIIPAALLNNWLYMIYLTVLPPSLSHSFSHFLSLKQMQGIQNILQHFSTK